ncbi:hypothetical protein INR49_011273 [Caranx melampygus]|nr:hypothetical protein INR49_011273 [Caranx melampygus]
MEEDTAREHCLHLLEEALHGHQGAEDAFNFDTLSMAVALEHEVFKSSKSSNLYKAAVLKKMKRKRVGAGLRGSSNPFQTASELLKSSMLDTASDKGSESGGFYNDSSGGSGESSAKVRIKETNTETSLAVTSSIRARANAVATSMNSPTKGGKAMSKKQQKLAEAAKSSRNISQYFSKKQTTEKSQEKPEVLNGLDNTLPQTTTVIPEENTCQQEYSPVTEEAVESSPVESETQGVMQKETKTEEIIVINDDDEEEETCETETSELEPVQETSKEDTSQNKPEEEAKPALTEEVGDMKDNRQSSPPAKRSRTAGGSTRRVTFNPNVQERALHPVEEPPKPVTLKEAADIVVRYLDPFYTQGKFATKELFKSFARYLSHLLAEGRSRGKGQVKAEAKALIKKFFSGVKRCESEEDWKHLKRPQSCKTTDNKE